ncbi:MAG: hypothetical protein KA419_18995 [Acidobacteria bacterium]|nr:hypothetical protein [Acidobacteriota bacterium]
MRRTLQRIRRDLAGVTRTVGVPLLAAALLLAAVRPLPAGETPAPPPSPDTALFSPEREQEILRGVKERIRESERQSLPLSYREHRVSTDFEGSGESGRRTEEIYRIVRHRGHQVYIQEMANGRRLPAEELAKQEERQRRELDEDAAKPSGRERIETIYLTPLLERYALKIAGREVLEGRPALKIRVDPLPGMFKDGRIALRILEKMAGWAWVAEDTLELLRIDVANISPISIGFGLAARVSLLQGSYRRKPYPGGAWFAEALTIRVKARIFLFKTLNRLSESTFFDVIFPDPGGAAPPSP